MRSRKTSETHSIPEVCLFGTLGTTYDSEGNPASLTYPSLRLFLRRFSLRPLSVEGCHGLLGR